MWYDKLIGTTVNELLILDSEGNCKCTCGQEVKYRLYHLNKGYYNSCGKCSPKFDLLEKRFGKLVVKHQVDERHWECACDCGGSIIVPTSRLVSFSRLKHNISSCGCLRDPKNLRKHIAEKQKMAKQISDSQERKRKEENPLYGIYTYRYMYKSEDLFKSIEWAILSTAYDISKLDTEHPTTYIELFNLEPTYADVKKIFNKKSTSDLIDSAMYQYNTLVTINLERAKGLEADIRALGLPTNHMSKLRSILRSPRSLLNPKYQRLEYPKIKSLIKRFETVQLPKVLYHIVKESLDKYINTCK